ELVRTCPDPGRLTSACRLNPFLPAATGDTVLDVVLVGPREWWIGTHLVRTRIDQVPGGLISLKTPPGVVSRAWLKMEEALWWSELPIRPGDECAEIGSAPGGASQAILARGARLYGIDPAEMAPEVLRNRRFTHIRKRTHEVRRRVFRNVKWLTADMNVSPDYTLDSVEGIVTHPECGVRGMILTLKLFRWALADEIPRFLERIRNWGFRNVRARQLQYNRQEICVTCNGRER
ncbi:MAG: SAM-dependent methyltransferase, partial [Planctomycetia bacterium]|nr:SAM-dependent methyltransferase [Planctomycetia bacterium]